MACAREFAWTSCDFRMPHEGVVVMTKIDDAQGVRNEAKLVFKNNLWWFDDMSMYVYYRPTHWAYL